MKKGTYFGKAATVDLIHADTKADEINFEENKRELSALQNQTYSNKCVCWRRQELKKKLQSFLPSQQFQKKRCNSFITL